MSTVEGEEKHLAAMAMAMDVGRSSNTYPYGGAEEEAMQLFDIPWEDVLIPQVACYLSLKDLFQLRVVSTIAKHFSEAAFAVRKELDSSFYHENFIKAVSAVLAEHCNNLESLQLLNCRLLDDKLLLELLRRNPRLRKLNLNDCHNLTAQALQPVIVGCKDLRKLELANCLWLTTGALEAFSLHHTNLECLNLTGCISVSENALVRLLKRQNKLNTLSLCKMTFITDRVLFTIARYCPLLELLNVQNCTQIGDAGITAIAQNCIHLKSLYVKNCRNVNENILTPLRRKIFIDRPNNNNFHHYNFYPNDFLIY